MENILTMQSEDQLIMHIPYKLGLNNDGANFPYRPFLAIFLNFQGKFRY